MPTLSARSFINRNDAEHAGAMVGQSYGAIIILILIYMSYNGMLPFCKYTTAIICVFTVLALRLSCEYYMGQRWDHFQRRRDYLVSTGVSAVKAFETVRDMR